MRLAEHFAKDDCNDARGESALNRCNSAIIAATVVPGRLGMAAALQEDAATAVRMRTENG